MGKMKELQINLEEMKMSHEGNDQIIDRFADEYGDDFPNCDPYVNFDHSDCSTDECKFDEGAYL